MSPLITVITPVLNAASFIQGCMESVTAQGCNRVVHLIVDGASSDGTPDIVRRYAQEHSHVQLISEKDSGQSDAMNRGISAATTPFIGFLNADDYYEPGTLNRICTLAPTITEPAFLYGNLKVWGDNDADLGLQSPAPFTLLNLCLGKPFPLNPASYFYHKSLHEVAGPYDVDDHYTMDLDFLFRASMYAKAYYHNELWGHFRLIEGTKTLGELATGESFRRQAALRRKYAAQLPVLQRAQVNIARTLEPLAKKVARRLKRNPS